MAHQVFISYSSKDATIAEQVCAYVESGGVSCWMAPRDILPGVDWSEAIIEGINAARVLVLIVSANSNVSPQIRREVERAVHKGLTIIPFRIEDVVPSRALEYFIGPLQGIDAFYSEYTDSLASLLEAVFDALSAPREMAASAPEPAPAKVRFRVSKLLIFLFIVANVLIVLAIVYGNTKAYLLLKRMGIVTKKEEVKPNDHYYEEGVRKYDSKDYQGAIESLNHAATSDPQNPSVYHYRAQAYYQLGQNQQAIDDFSRAIALDPNKSAIYKDRGAAYSKTGDYQHAIQDYTKAIEIAPNDSDAYKQRAQAYDATGDHRSALQDYSNAITKGSDDWNVYYNRGMEERKVGLDQEAITDFTQSIRLNASYAPAYNNRGLSYRKVGRVDSAISDYTQAITLDPKYGEAYCNRGDALAVKKEYEQAQNDFIKCGKQGDEALKKYASQKGKEVAKKKSKNFLRKLKDIF